MTRAKASFDREVVVTRLKTARGLETWKLACGSLARCLRMALRQAWRTLRSMVVDQVAYGLLSFADPSTDQEEA